MTAAGAATRKLFGTDGVRGVAGEFLTAELALSLARAATARVQTDTPARVLIIRDTRESGEMLEAAVAAGIAAAGGEALLGGVLPTPGAPLLIGRTLAVRRTAAVPESSWSFARTFLPAFLGLLVATALLAVGLGWWFRRGDRILRRCRLREGARATRA